MKKIFLILLLMLFFTGNAYAAGTITQTLEYDPAAGHYVLTFTCVGDAADGTFPSTGNAVLSTDNLAKLKGMYIIEVRTDPQTTNPTAAWDAVINDTGGLDLMGGTLANRSASATESAIPAMITGIYGGRKVIDAFTLVITNNIVHSAGIIVKVILER